MTNKICFVASEGIPYIKSGGLADVIGALPKALIELGDDVRVFLPLYKKNRKQRKDLQLAVSFQCQAGMFDCPVNVYQDQVGAVIYYFIEHQGYFERDELYGYGDDGERFAFFQHALLQACAKLAWLPDVFHCHDWHTGLIPVLCKEVYGEPFRAIKHVFTIHNLAFQGISPREILTGCLGMSDQYYTNGSLRFYDNCISFMKAGILYADKVTTVSKTYAQEILTPEFGENMQEVLRFRSPDLSGIVNGIDIDLWNPETDEALYQTYSKRNYLKGKALNKQSLQFQTGLEDKADTMVLALVSRLTDQKGLNLLALVLDQVMTLPVQVVILGTGEARYEDWLRQCESRYKGRLIYYAGYNEQLAHQIYGGADVLLMPSNFEPCGISQLISMHYGTLPLVRETGGLKDTVVAYNQYTQEGTGFSYQLNTPEAFMTVLNIALDLYTRDSAQFHRLMRNAMALDVSWKKSALEYQRLYDGLFA